MTGRPLVLAHRGASAAAPENTLEAYALARTLGADGVELDVRRSVDGVLVVHHDPQADGIGLLAARAFAEIRRERPAIPTLDEALAECRGLLVNAEVKCLPWEPDADTDGSVVRAAVDAVAGHDGGVFVSSFDLAAVDRARDHAAALRADLATGWLTYEQDPARAAELAAAHGHAWCNPDAAAVLAAGPEAVASAHAAGVRVCVWTVDDPGDARMLAAADVDIIITNVPDVVIAAIR